MNIKSLFATLLAAVTLSACTEPAIDDLEGKYPAPEELSLTEKQFAFSFRIKPAFVNNLCPFKEI